MRKLLLFLFNCVTIISYAQDNIGIGTTNPSEKLEVNGNIKADTLKPNTLKITANAADGNILTSDAQGNASWRPTGAVGSSKFFVTLNNNTHSQGRLGFSLTSGALTQKDSVDFLTPRYLIGSDINFATTGTTGNRATVVNSGFYHLEWEIRFFVSQTTTNLFPNGSVSLLVTEPSLGNAEIVVNDFERITQNDFVSIYGYAKGITGHIDIYLKAGATFTLNTGFGNLSDYPLIGIGVTTGYFSGYRISD